MDFFSWHSYEKPEATRKFAAYLEKRLDEAGFSGLETHCNEWNPDPTVELRGSSLASADVAATMCAMQDTKTAVMCYYDARMGTSEYGGLFNPMTRKPLSPYYAVKAFGELYTLGTEVRLEGLEPGTYGLAAIGEDGRRALLLTNLSKEEKTLTVNVAYSHRYRVDEVHALTDEGAFTDGITLGQYEVLLLTDYELS